MSPSLRLGKVFSFNSQTISNRTFLSKRFFGNNTFSSEWIVKAIKLCPILSSSKLLVSFRHDLVGSPRFSADAHRHQVFSWTVLQAGWSLAYSPLQLWFFTTLSRLIRLHSSPSTSLPLCAPNSFGESFASFMYVMICFWLSALQIPWENRHEIQVSSTSCGSLLMRR